MDASSSADSPMETASSSADPGPPLWNLEGRPLKFVFHGVSYTAHVQDIVRREEISASVVNIKVSGAPRRLPFPGGERALLITGEGKQWACRLNSTDDAHNNKGVLEEGALGICSDLYHRNLSVHVPDTGRDGLSFIEFASSVFVHFMPVTKRFRPSVHKNPWGCRSLQDPIESAIPIKIGINGFGKIGRLLADVALQSIDVELVAINDYSIENISIMVNAWKSKNVGVTLKDYKTLLFQKTYNESISSVLFEYKEVVVFNFRNEADIPWDGAGAEFVLHSAGFYSDNAFVQKVNDGTHDHGAAIVPNSLDSCLRHLPKVISAFGLNCDKPMTRSSFNDANQVDSIRAACLDIITRSKRAVEFVLVDVIGSVFPSVCGASVPLLASSVEAALCILMYVVRLRRIFQNVSSSL